MTSYHLDMSISEVLSSHPGAPAIFERHGLACASCLAASAETLESVASMHDVSTSELIDELDALDAASDLGEGR